METLGIAVSLATFGMLALTAIHHHFDPQSGSMRDSISTNAPLFETMQIESALGQYPEHMEMIQMNRQLLNPSDTDDLNEHIAENPPPRNEAVVAADIVHSLEDAVVRANQFHIQLDDDGSKSWTKEGAINHADEIEAIADKLTGELNEYVDRHQDVHTGTTEEIFELATGIQSKTKALKDKLEEIIGKWQKSKLDIPLPVEEIQYHNDQIKKVEAVVTAKKAATQETHRNPTKERDRYLQWLNYSGLYAQWELSKLWNLLKVYSNNLEK